MTASASPATKTVFWHRELPPLSAEPIGDHIVEAASQHVPGTLAHRDELWDQCYANLMARTHVRLEQEVDRLGGDLAHVVHESVETRHDDARGETWLRGRFTYVLYRLPKSA
jgi:hypothetical protein